MPKGLTAIETKNAKKSLFPNIRQINPAFLITSTLFHHPWNSGKPRHSDFNRAQLKRRRGQWNRQPLRSLHLFNFSTFSTFQLLTFDLFQLFNFSTFDLLISQAARYSQARQDGADDSRQRLQDEFPSLLPFHNLPFTDLPFTIFPITPSFPITPIPLPLSSPLLRRGAGGEAGWPS